MDKQVFVLISDQIKWNAVSCIQPLPADGRYEIWIMEVKKDKTLKQLGALFGLWVKFLANELAESEDYIHRMLKAKFLARIYIIEPLTSDQEQWVELLAIYQEAGETEKLLRHARRISLSWAKLSQMKYYLEAVENHYQAEGLPLPVIDKYWKHNK